MSDNPYRTPEAALDQPAPQIDIPEEITKKIKNCWIAGLISIAITLVFTLIAISGTNILGLNAWSFIDVAILAALTFGVYKKSRVCATLLLVFFVVNKVIMWMEAGTPSGLPMAIVFFWFFGQGVVGTFQFHKLKNQQTQNTPAPAPSQ